MRETFEEYKSTIENNVIKFTYLYDGDVLSSKNESYSEILKHSSVSPNVIISSIIDIYNKSIKEMMNRSIEISIPLKITNKYTNTTEDNIFYYIDKLKESIVGFNPLYVFCSENGRKLFGITKVINKSKPFPGYLYDIERYHSRNYDLYLSPLLYDTDDVIEVYVIDKSIQSLVYSIQNMEYDIEKISSDIHKHTINYKLYDCDFTCYKLIIKDISRIREDKINQLLNVDRL